MGIWGDVKKAFGRTDREPEAPQEHPRAYRDYERSILSAEVGSRRMPDGATAAVVGDPDSAARREWARSSFNAAIRPMEPGDGMKPDPALMKAIDAKAVGSAVNIAKPIGEAMAIMRGQIAGEIRDMLVKPVEIDKDLREQAEGLAKGSWSDQHRDRVLGPGEVMHAPVPGHWLDEGVSRRRWHEDAMVLRTEAARAGLLSPEDLVEVAAHRSMGRSIQAVDPKTIGADFAPKAPAHREGPDAAYLERAPDETLRKRFEALPGMDRAEIPTEGGGRTKWIEGSMRGMQLVEHAQRSNPALAGRIDGMRREWSGPAPQVDPAIFEASSLGKAMSAARQAGHAHMRNQAQQGR